jgi:hypothetical protein
MNGVNGQTDKYYFSMPCGTIYTLTVTDTMVVLQLLKLVTVIDALWY